jgi:integrase
VRSVWKNGRWTWRGELRLPDNSLKTCEDANYAAAVEKLKALRKKYGNVSASGKHTLYEEALAWLEGQESRNRDTNTLHNYRYHIEVSIAPDAPGEKLGRRKPIAVTIGDLDRLFVTLAKTGGKNGKGLKYHTLAHVSSTLVQIFDQIQRDGKLDQNVALKARLPGEELLARPKPTRAPTRQQIEDIFAEAAESDPMVGQFLLLGVGIGSRPGECLGATWENLNWESGMLTVISAVKRKVGYVYTDGRRVHEKLLAKDTLKTEGSRRNVKLPKFALDALRARQVDQDKQRIEAGDWWREQGLVFTTGTGGPISHSYMKKRLTKVIDAINEDVADPAAQIANWSITALTRRSFATRAAAHMDREKMARQLGHKHGNTRMVEQYYIDHDQLPDNTEGAAVMEEVFGGGA